VQYFIDVFDLSDPIRDELVFLIKFVD